MLHLSPTELNKNSLHWYIFSNTTMKLDELNEDANEYFAIIINNHTLSC